MRAWSPARAVATAAALGAATLAACTVDDTVAPVPASTATSTSSTGGDGGGSLAGGLWPGGASSSVEVVWATRWGGRNTDERVAAVVAEPDDAVVVAGTIGAFDAVDPTVRAGDEEDVLLARFDAEGAVAAVQVLGSFGNDAPRALLRRDDGTLVVAGVFSTVIDAIDPPLVAFGGPAVFAATLGHDLAPTWGAAILGADTGRGQVTAAVDAEGAIVVAGTFARVLAVEDVILIDDDDGVDGFVARFAPEGPLAWVLQLDGAAAEHLEIGAAAAVEDDVVVAAQLRGALTLDGEPVAESLGARRPVLLRFDPSGAVVGATTLAGAGSASVTRIVERPGGLLLATAIGGTVLTGEGAVETAGEGDATLVWTDGAGTPLFGRAWGDRRAQGIAAIDVDAAGTIVATGSFQGGIDFGTGVHKAPGGRPDGFAVELSPAGDPLRAFTAHDPPLFEGDRPGSQSVGAGAWMSDGGVVLGGSFTGELALGGALLASRGALDGWIARVAPR